MPKIYLPLPTLGLKPNTHYIHPPDFPEILHLEGPALKALIDFHYIKPHIISAESNLDQAFLAIKHCFYHALLVVNPKMNLLGIISAEDLLGEKPLKAIQNRQLTRSDLTVEMVMIPRNELIAIDIEELKHAKVGNLVATLQTHKQHHILVTESTIPEEQAVCGLFSAALLSKQLNLDILSDTPQAKSIAELQHRLHLDD